MKNLTRRMAILAIAAAPLTLAACNDDDDNITSPSTGTALVRVAHLSPDAPLVDIWVNEVKALSGVAYKDISGYLPIPSGSVNIKVRPANAATPV